MPSRTDASQPPFLRVAAWLLLAMVAGSSRMLAADPAPPMVLRSAAAVRELTPKEADQQQPVQLRGVVTFCDTNLFSQFLQDETAGIYLQGSNLLSDLVPGDLIEVQGKTSPGEYAPIIVPERVNVVGKSELPKPQSVTYEELASGQKDSQFVEIGGVVRNIYFNTTWKHYLIEIATGGGRVTVYLKDLPEVPAERLLDSTVRARGVCSTLFNRQRQLFAIRLLVPRPEDLLIEHHASVDPYSLKPRPIGSLMQFSPEEPVGHRVKVVGTVIYFEPGRVVNVQEGEYGLELLTRSRTPLQPGDRVEALGFVEHGQYTPVLQDAVYRKLGTNSPIEPAELTTAEVLKGKHDCRLIRVSARLLDRALHGAERYLILQDGNVSFNAYLRNGRDGPDPFSQFRNGSVVSVVGVCHIDPGEWLAGEAWRARSFRIELRSAADVTLLAGAPWWTLQRLLWIIVIMAMVAVATFAWATVLRRQVAERTRQLEIQIVGRQRAERRREIEQERTRVAQDLHDELGSTLTEVSILGALARNPAISPESRERNLDQLARVTHSLVSTLDEIVWAVNPKYDSVASLASYYSLFAQRFLNLAGIRCRLKVAEFFPENPLDSHVRHGVFLAFREALNNAIRHSKATEVGIEMAVEGNQLKILVTDNGKGFSVSDVPPGSDGLASMRTRLQKLGGRCEIRSEPGKGTTVEFHLTLGESQP